VSALHEGFALLRDGAPALPAVERAIRVLEGAGLFNAGMGAKRQLDGVRRMDASLMEGKTLRAGAVAAIEGVRHPITAARMVMEHTDHVLLVGPHATRFARFFGLERQPMAATRMRAGAATPEARRVRALYRAIHAGPRRPTGELGTVGAVALDGRGSLAAGASTGGIGTMLPGRVGDSPLIGSGVYADDDAGAVSMTGRGESIIRIGVAKDIIEKLRGGGTPARAGRMVLERLADVVGGDAGALIVDRTGWMAIRHTSRHMAAGYWRGTGHPVVLDRFR
jgi:beta-aspartyl-peptidase (threonine type)